MAQSDAERQKNSRKNKLDDGYIWFGRWIKPEWKKDIINLINTLKGDAK